MSGFISSLSPAIEAFMNYREALGFSHKTHMYQFLSLDRFFANQYPNDDCLTQSAVMEWLEDQCSDVQRKATAVRLLGKYMTAIGKESYVLPTKIIYNVKTTMFEPYIFTDSEISALFCAIDTTPATKAEPFLNEILPVLFRLIYTCGLRPGEGRGMEHQNVNLKTGEVLITNTKKKKDRIVVMSNDMQKLCRIYDERRAIFAKDNRFFFPSWSGGALSDRQITYHFRNCWVRACGETQNIPSVRVYDLRHRFASAALNRWMDSGQDLYSKLPYLRTYMGHSHLNETLYYVHLLPENLVKSPGIDWGAFDGIMPEVVVCPE